MKWHLQHLFKITAEFQRADILIFKENVDRRVFQQLFKDHFVLANLSICFFLFRNILNECVKFSGVDSVLYADADIKNRSVFADMHCLEAVLTSFQDPLNV